MVLSELTILYKKVQKGVKSAQKQLISEHKRHFPHSEYNSTRPSDIGCEYQQNLHIIYLRLSKELNKNSK